MAAVVRIEEWDVHQRLSELDLSHSDMTDIVLACVAAHGGCTDDDPPAARGWEVWRWGVRRSREILQERDWTKDNSGGYPTVVNHSKRIRIAIAGTDEATGLLGDKDPKNRSGKGPASEKATTTNQMCLPGAESWPASTAGDVEGYETWHLCVFIKEDHVRAELARFSGFEAGFFTRCQERIILIGGDDWTELEITEDDLGPEFEVDVQAKV